MTEDINMYYQVQKLRIWSFFLLLLHQNIKSLKTSYLGKRVNIFKTKNKCQICSAKIKCSCKILQVFHFKLDQYYKQICSIPDQVKQSFSDYLEEESIDRRSNFHQFSIYMSKQLPQNPSLFWDLDNVTTLISILQLNHFEKLIHQNKIDGFVLMILVNPPFSEKDSFLKFLLHSVNYQPCMNQLCSNNREQEHSFLYLLHQSLIQIELIRASGLLPQRHDNQIQHCSPTTYFMNPLNYHKKLLDLNKQRQNRSPGVENRTTYYCPQEQPQEIEMQEIIQSIHEQQQEDNELIISKKQSYKKPYFLDINTFLSKKSSCTDLSSAEYMATDGTTSLPDRVFFDTDIPKLQSRSRDGSILISNKAIKDEAAPLDTLQGSVDLQCESVLMESQQGSILCVDEGLKLDNQDSIDSESSLMRKLKLDVKEIIQSRTLNACFSAFDFTVTCLLKLQSELFSRVQTIPILGASFGRSEQNTYALPDQTKISAQHARIVFRDNKFHLQDRGSKGGTFLRIHHNFLAEKKMQIYIGNIFAFKIIDLQSERGYIKVQYEKKDQKIEFEVKMTQGERWKVGKDKSQNQSSFEKSGCYKLLSPQHFEMVYEMNWKLGRPMFMINDNDSKNGTWLRIGEKQKESPLVQLERNSTFSLSFEAVFKVLDVNH